MSDLYLQSVVVSKDKGYADARACALKYLASKKKEYFTMDDTNYTFRNLPKSMFNTSSIKLKREAEGVCLVLGKLK